ncbi:hypothetical protein ACFQY4_01495 [Catellatospora bangladeshensis]|uniref:Uncharacterized protein n=1 Tax=Catellatospora bangladeshensis TaxID=310355 RepID=A0A8J3NHG2_9ACTN|nr:hypothetical protein [Catellatospora bangladeshensis]GIF81385.1 hypothetical protein Cba03nite_27340 [Catellatospora bangladeshensis]
MPNSDTRDEQRHARLLPVLFWGGVGLAPLAALFLFIADGGTALRAAVGVVILSVILIGLSITLRRDTETVRLELEDMILDEIDTVRTDVRDDISTAAHATHRAFGDKFQYLVDQLEATRHELEATRAQLEAVRAEVARSGQAAPAGAGRGGPSPAPHQPAPHGGRAGMPGVVRHTETVQVTTRQTIVDPHGEDNQRGAVYGSPAGGFDRGRDTDYGSRAESPREERRSRSERRERDRHEESWTEQRLREQLERRREADEPVSGGDSWTSRRDRDDDRRPGRADAIEGRWSERDDDERPGVRAGDRWASVRSDDRGREVRMGERRAALHSDGSGTELRIEDRWAAVRREDNRPSSFFDDDQDDDRGSRREPRAITGSDREERWSDYEDDRGRGRERERDRGDYDRRYR